MRTSARGATVITIHFEKKDDGKIPPDEFAKLLEEFQRIRLQIRTALDGRSDKREVHWDIECSKGVGGAYSFMVYADLMQETRKSKSDEAVSGKGPQLSSVARGMILFWQPFDRASQDEKVEKILEIFAGAPAS